MLIQRAWQPPDQRQSLGQADAELEQETMGLIGSLVRSRTNDSRIRCSTDRVCWVSVLAARNASSGVMLPRK